MEKRLLFKLRAAVGRKQPRVGQSFIEMWVCRISLGEKGARQNQGGVDIILLAQAHVNRVLVWNKLCPREFYGNIRALL